MHDGEYRRLKNVVTQAGDDADDELQRERSRCHPRQSCMYTPMNLQLRSQRQHAGGSECTLTGTAASAAAAAAAAAAYSKYAGGFVFGGWGGGGCTWRDSFSVAVPPWAGWCGVFWPDGLWLEEDEPAGETSRCKAGVNQRDLAAKLRGGGYFFSSPRSGRREAQSRC